MGLEKDTLHVVIRLPFKRPKGFIEPPSIIWTDEMDHKLWQYMSQKNTDWNYIADQLGVPTSYLVRHAAFIYETQLRGIQQQLRMNGSRNTKSPVQTTSKPTSVRYSNTYQQQQEEQSRRNRDESMILSNLSNISPRIPEREIASSHSSNKQQEVPLHNTVYKSTSSQHSRESDTSDSAQEEEEEETEEEEEKSLGELGANIRGIGGMESETEEEEEEDGELNQLKDVQDLKEDEEEGSKGEDEDEEEEFSSHFERMKLQMEEPAFLPRRLDQSRQSSMQLKREQHTPTTQGSPAAQPVTPSSALNSVGSSFSDLSDSSITQSALEDAYMSKFNQGSKMSIFNLSRKY